MAKLWQNYRWDLIVTVPLAKTAIVISKLEGHDVFLIQSVRRRPCMFLLACVSTAAITLIDSSSSADVSCQFKSDAESVDTKVIVNGKEYWHAMIQKGETKKLVIPEGPFTVVSKVYNPNLKAHEDIRTEAHTRLCTEQVALPVPLFSPEPK